MRFLGRQKILAPSSAPVIAVLIFSTATNKPAYAWVQESQSDVAQVMYDGVGIPCVGILDDVSIRSSRPQSGGGLRRNVTSLKLNVTNEKGYPILEDPIVKGLYYGGSNLDDFYFGIFGIDRQHLNEDIKNGASYGFYKVDNEIAWTEVEGIQTINLTDILLTQTSIAGATTEVIPDIFFIYNPWFEANLFRKAYGQVPRIKLLNAFPSFSVKNFAASISGKVRSVYTNVSTSIILEENVNESSLLLQAVAIGGVARIRMPDGEVIAGTLVHDAGLHTISITPTIRNTYYNRVTAYNDSLDGRSQNQWGAAPSYSTVQFSPFQTIIPNAKDLILDQNGFMQADIQFFDPNNAVDKSYTVTNCVAKLEGILEQRKDVVIHSFWPDDRFPNWHNQGSISGFYNNTSNSTYIPANQVPIWGIAAFQFLKFRTTVQKINLYFNDPRVSVPGSGAVGGDWSMVNIEPVTIDKSCYIRNGYSKFDVNRVYVEGEGKLIQVPPANVTITQSGTFYGLTNLAKITFTELPLDMNIGAKSNLVYTDALYRTTTPLESRAESVLREIIKEDPTLSTMLGDTLLVPQTNNYLPYIGWVISSETTLTDIIDKICYQCGITLRWRRNKFDIVVAGQYDHVIRDYVAPAPILPEDPPAGTYSELTILATDSDEMLENTAGLRIGRLKTTKHITGALEEYVPLYFKSSYGAWEDPFYAAVRPSMNRNIKPYERVVEYHFDLINDASSFAFAVRKSLSIGHPSGYALAQRALIVDMSLDGCQWEAMDPIALHHFPLISTVDETNAYYVDNAIMYPKRTDARPYLMGALCMVEDVTYAFNVINPVVSLYARNSQPYVEASGTSGGGGGPSTPPPPLIPVIPVDPNIPPNGGGGGGSHTVVGNDWLMPHIVTPNPVTFDQIVDQTTQTENFDITVDAGFIFNKGWAFSVYIETEQEDGVSLAVNGLELGGSTSGSFPDKYNDNYIPLVFTAQLSVNYLWFSTEGAETYTKPANMILHKRWIEGQTPCEEFVTLETVTIRRKDITGVTGT